MRKKKWIKCDDIMIMFFDIKYLLILFSKKSLGKIKQCKFSVCIAWGLRMLIWYNFSKFNDFFYSFDLKEDEADFELFSNIYCQWYQ